MTILPAHTQRIIFHKAMASAHLIAAEFDCSATDVIDLVVGGLLTTETRIPVSTPSQPEVPTHATAAQTDGAAEPPVPTEPSVDLSGLAAHEQGPSPSPAVPPAGDAADGQAETLLSKSSVAPIPKAKRKMAHARVKDAFEANPSGTTKQIAAAAGVHPSTASIWLTQLRKDVAAKTREALKAPAKPQEAVEPPPAPKARPEPEQPPVNTADPRFYVIDVDGRYVHSRLQPTHTGMGLKMTDEPRLAWKPTEAQFGMAVKRYPQLASMRWEAVSHA